MTAEVAFEDLLAEAGVDERTLSVAERRALDEEGYLVVPGALGASLVSQIREVFDRRCDAEAGGRERTGTRHAGNLHEDPVFVPVYTDAKLLAAAWHILRRPFRTTGVAGRDPLPGFGAQALHADWGPRQPGEPFSHVNSLWLLDDFTAQNGCTRVVPGSHRRHGKLPRGMNDPAYHDPAERRILAPAGSVLIFNAHLLHGGTQNRSRSARRVLTCAFVARDAGYYLNMEGSGLSLPDTPQVSGGVRALLLG